MPPPLDAIDEDINQMIFPGVDEKYTYDPKHFRYIDIIESSRHIVKEFVFDPLKLPMAVKTIRISQNRYQEHENDVKKLEREVKSFRQLSHHPNIVNFYGLCFNDEEAMICMELMDLSLYDLYLVVHEQKEKFPESILGYITVKCLDALGFCKKQNLIHRDVKPKNILLNNKGEIKLCDFGESRILKDSLASTFVGTIVYWPPERFISNDKNIVNINEEKYDIRSDIWSLGITLTETTYGMLPFKDDQGRPINSENTKQENIVTIQHSILSADAGEMIERCFGNDYSNELKSFVRSCLEKKENRPKYDVLMKESFYSRYASVNKSDMADFIKMLEEDEDDSTMPE